MLLDEPNTHLDFCTQHHIMQIIRNMVVKRNTAALITFHNPNLALYYCDEAVLLKNGEVIDNGPTSQVLTTHGLQKVLGDNICVDQTIGGRTVVVPQTAISSFSTVDYDAQRRHFGKKGFAHAM